MFAPIEDAIEDIRQGKFVVVVDAADRENEGDLTIAAQFATPEAVNFMAKHARGLVCLCLTPERVDELGLRMMTDHNETPFETAFTVAIEAREGVTTGISAHDRARTIQVAIDPSKGHADIVEPGHVFPLRARARRRARARGPDGGGGRPGAARGPAPGRGRLRGDEGRRDDGARPRPDRVLQGARAEDDHGRGPDRVPAPPRQARRAHRRRRGCRPPTASSRRSRSARSSPARPTSRSCAARSTAPRTCSFACTRSA